MVADDLQDDRISTRARGGRLLRRATLAAGAFATALTGVLAAVTAAGTRGHHTASPAATTTSGAATVPAVPAPTATVASGSATSAPSAAQSAPTAPSAPPSSSSSAPVAVSGGS
jgi:hypothetical protein